MKYCSWEVSKDMVEKFWLIAEYLVRISLFQAHLPRLFLRTTSHVYCRSLLKKRHLFEKLSKVHSYPSCIALHPAIHRRECDGWGGQLLFVFNFRGHKFPKTQVASILYNILFLVTRTTLVSGFTTKFIFLLGWLHPQTTRESSPGSPLALGPPLPPVPLHYSKSKLYFYYLLLLIARLDVVKVC